ncbi:MAG: hydantoinase/oxoprolinase family protein [Caldimonas sp.]
MAERTIFGWDVGGAHLKGCRMEHGRVVDVAQWACPLWQGTDRLQAALQDARARWPGLERATHAVTMTGELVDLFASREEGVRRIAAEVSRGLGAVADADADPSFVATSSTPCGDSATPASFNGSVHFYAGDSGWCRIDEVGACWEAIASANWLATARHAALRCGDGVLVDIGSTTTDLIAFRDGRVTTRSRTDAQRLGRGELVYHGVVRTPLCALGPRVDWRGTPHNVMNEFFATTADVYRLTGELDAAHDLYPSADNAPKHAEATRQRLARMIGLDQREADAAEWLAFARAWRAAQVAEIGGQLRRVLNEGRFARDAVIVGAGCGDFLVADALACALDDGSPPAPDRTAWRIASYGSEVARLAGDGPVAVESLLAWTQVAAPAVATASLFDGDRR